MRNAIQWTRSLVFVTQMYLALPLMAIFFLPVAVFRRDYAYTYVKTYARYVRWTLGWMTGLKTEIRGKIPTGECIIASKHQSFLDVLMISSVATNSRFIIKRELHRVPIFHFFGARMGNVAVKRGDKGRAIKKMLADVASGKTQPGQLVIYPQGTRISPGVAAPYKIGAGLIYEQTGQTCVPAATNVGVFWPKHGIMRQQGLAVVEFLEPIPPGLERKAFMARLEEAIETSSDQLVAETGFLLEPPDTVS